MMADIQKMHPSFLKDLTLLEVLVSNSTVDSQFFSSNYTNEVVVKILVSKRYTRFYFANYVLTVGYNPASSSGTLKQVEALPSNAVGVRHCLRGQNNG
jgi:hypothetical protein